MVSAEDKHLGIEVINVAAEDIHNAKNAVNDFWGIIREIDFCIGDEIVVWKTAAEDMRKQLRIYVRERLAGLKPSARNIRSKL